jgi:hypothetical protein
MKTVFILFVAIFALSVPAQAANAETQPQVINVGVYLLNVGKFELSTGSYTMDFYLSLTSDRPIPPNSFEFMNGRAASIDKLIDEETNKFYRVQANLYQNINLRDYPFDEHTLTIQIEDKTNALQNVVYRVDQNNSGVDPDVTIVGWELNGYDATVEKHEYAVFEETYSKYVFDVRIRRIVLTSILKAFMPAGFIVLVGLLALMLKPDKFAPRLGLNTSSLLGAVMFHLNVTSQIPPVGYLTFADWFMIVSYVVLIASLISTIILMRHTDKNEEALALQIYQRALTWIPPFALVLYVAAFLAR